VDKNGNRNLSKGYLNYLYSPKGQELAAKHFFRPRNKQVANKYLAQFPKQKTFNINDVFGGWAKAQKTHFVNGAIFDQIYTEKLTCCGLTRSRSDIKVDIGISTFIIF